MQNILIATVDSTPVCSAYCFLICTIILYILSRVGMMRSYCRMITVIPLIVLFVTIVGFVVLKPCFDTIERDFILFVFFPMVLFFPLGIIGALLGLYLGDSVYTKELKRYTRPEVLNESQSPDIPSEFGTNSPNNNNNNNNNN